MKTGLSITQWASEIERQAKAKSDYIVDTRSLTLNESLELEIQENRFPLQSLAHKQIAQRLDIPARYYDKMRESSPALLRENVNHWLASKPEKRMIRTLDGEARAFLSDRYQRIDNNHVVEAVIPILSQIPGLEVKSCQVTPSKLYLKAVSTETRLLVPGSKRVGDYVESGLMITNSEVGQGALSIQPFFHFLVCTNGMVRNREGLRAYHVGGRQGVGVDVWDILSDDTKRLEDKATLAKIRDIVAASMDRVRFEETVALMGEKTQNEITGDVPNAIKKAGEILKLTDEESSSVLRHLISGGDLSQYGLMNAVTRTAEDLDSYDRATELETMGGMILDLPRSQWEVISRQAA